MQEDLYIQPGIKIPYTELSFKSSRASGSGGQHVNKSNTRIQLLWNVNHSVAFNDEQKSRLRQKLSTRISKQGYLQVACALHRSQKRNQEEACELFVVLLQKALYVPKERKATKVSRSQKAKRLNAKKQRSDIKKKRGKVKWD